ncbi:MAG: hypothetical protein VX642_10640 [Bdellovibrionota bacterium]|nr:hypothetical protein [Bdellovibrionota bacterium]
MPFILSPMIREEFEGMWFEGNPYSKESIYQIKEGNLPPVNYDLHKIASHSLTHAEAPKHTQKEGAGIEAYFLRPNLFFGKARVLRLKGDGYKLVDQENQVFHWEVSLDELQSQLKSVPEKLLLTSDEYPVNEETPFHDPKYVLTLSEDAARFLLSESSFHLYGTSWKSSDYKPGSKERPIHNLLFEKAMILENLDLKEVPDGDYFYCGAPLPLVGASESPICPMLFSYDEIFE